MKQQEMTHLIEIWLLIREGLRAAVKGIRTTDFRDGLKGEFIYEDGIKYEIEIRAVREQGTSNEPQG